MPVVDFKVWAILHDSKLELRTLDSKVEINEERPYRVESSQDYSIVFPLLVYPHFMQRNKLILVDLANGNEKVTLELGKHFFIKFIHSSEDTRLFFLAIKQDSSYM